MSAGRERRARRIHLIAGVLACAVVPLASYAGLGPPLAWSMYSGGGEYRLEITALASGGPEPIAPTRLAAYVRPDDVPFFAGADHFRYEANGYWLRQALPEVAALACRATHAPRVRVTLEERWPPAQRRPITDTAERRCAR